MAIGTKNELLHCENCGEDYSATYKRCPFCDEAAGTRRRNTRGGGYGGSITPNQIVAMIVSIALIGAAVWIVFSFVEPLVRQGQPGADPSLVSPPPVVSPIPGAAQPDDPAATLEPDASPAVPENTPAPIAASNATGVRLNRSDFTLNSLGESFRMTATLSPADATATLVWSTDDNSIVRVSADGVVTAVGNGTTKISVQAGPDIIAECTVRVTNQPNNGGGGSSSSSSGSSSGSDTTASNTGTLTINRTDMTLRSGESFTLKINGADSITWTTTDSSKATVDADGKVTGVGAGSCRVQGTVNGTVYECIVRVRG